MINVLGIASLGAFKGFVGPPSPQSFSWSEMGLYFILALSVSLLGALWILQRKGRLGLDRPDGIRKLHDQAVPRLGGIPIYCALLLGMVLVPRLSGLYFEGWLPLVLCNTLMFAVGFIDDLRPLGARIKLVGQLGTALMLYFMGLSIDMLSNPFGEGGINLGWLSLPLTVLWLVAIPNIINLIDGMDGLAGGFGLFLSLTLAFVGYVGGHADVMVACIIMAGALTGFLFFNLPPAKIFLGDGGAYLIGFFIASASLKSSNKGSVIAALLVIVIALGVPILDTAFAIMRRAIRGVPIFSADAEHIHHRLILLGYSKGRALVAMYSVCLVLSLVGISILMTKGVALPIAGAVLFLLAVGAARYLGYVRSWSNLRLQISQAMERRKRFEHVQAHAHVLEFDLEKCESLEDFTELVSNRWHWLGFRMESGAGTIPVIVKLSGGLECVLHCPGDIDTQKDWVRRGDTFVTMLERSIERWGSVPEFFKWESENNA